MLNNAENELFRAILYHIDTGTGTPALYESMADGGYQNRDEIGAALAEMVERGLVTSSPLPFSKTWWVVTEAGWDFWRDRHAPDQE